MSTSTATRAKKSGTKQTVKPPLINMRLEVIVIPVGDPDRALEFYQSLGWRVDADFEQGPNFRVVQVTPPASECSIIFGKGVTEAKPGTAQGLHLTVSDIEIARKDLSSRGVKISEVFHDKDGIFHHGGNEARERGPAPDHASYGSFFSFSDPDGNGWLVQEIQVRLPGR